MAQLVGASSSIPKGCGFDPLSGHIARLWVQSRFELHMEYNWLMFLSSVSLSLSPSPSLSPTSPLLLSLPLSLPLSLSCSNYILGIKKKLYCDHVSYMSIAWYFLKKSLDIHHTDCVLVSHLVGCRAHCWLVFLRVFPMQGKYSHGWFQPLCLIGKETAALQSKWNVAFYLHFVFFYVDR